MSKKTTSTIAIVAALVAVLAVPVFAQAGNGHGRQNDKRTAAAAKRKAGKTNQAAKKGGASKESSRAVETKGQPKAQLEKRIKNKLAARRHRFDAVSANLNKRIARIESLSSVVASYGGDVGGVIAALDSARTHLANATALEQETVARFTAIPDASNRRTAFVGARAKGREAVAELKLARSTIRDAAELLRNVVEGLKAPTETVDAP